MSGSCRERWLSWDGSSEGEVPLSEPLSSLVKDLGLDVPGQMVTGIPIQGQMSQTKTAKTTRSKTLAGMP